MPARPRHCNGHGPPRRARTSLTTPLGNREGERRPEARRPLRSRHHAHPRGRVGGAFDDANHRRSRPSHRPGETGGFISGRLTHRCLLALLLLLSGAACRRPAAAATGVRVADDAGDTVSVAAPVRRIASLIPATTELLFAIGAGDAVVGRTTWCDYPPAASRVTNLGDGIAPSLEAILAIRPDLVLLYNSAQNAGAAARLRRLGVPTLLLNTDALADVGRVARLLGRVTGRERRADSVVATFERSLAAASPPAAARRPRVLLLVWEQPPMTIGRGSFLSDLVRRAGGVNLFDDVGKSSGTISIEAVAARDPDLILTTAEGPTAFATRPEWQVVRAVRERRFLQVNGSEFNRPSPRAPTAVRILARRMAELAR
jgi:iron complex transport system substrate-binding protein